MLGLRGSDRDTYLGQQVLVRAQAERLCPRAFQFFTSLWEEMFPSAYSISPVLDNQSGSFRALWHRDNRTLWIGRQGCQSSVNSSSPSPSWPALS